MGILGDNCLNHRADTLFLYRDLKPDNILLDCTGHVKYADFGLAATDMCGSKTLTENVGTQMYQAPKVSKRLIICWSNMPIHRAIINQIRL